MSIAYIFPGQGSQYAGMGRELAETFSVAREVFEEADEVLRFSLSRLCFGGSAEELQSTENAQPAILAASIAAWRVVVSEGVQSPSYVAGHSLGEYSALVAANALTLEAALQTVRARGRYMQGTVPVGVGAMAAVGAELQIVTEVCAQSRQHGVCALANINSPKQIVITGDVAAVDFAIELLTKRGIRRVKKLNVSAPFHCELMRPAEDRLTNDLAAVEFRDLSLPLVTNVDATLISKGTEARDALRRQVSRTVRWQESVELLSREGVTRFVEIGPGKVLSGLVRQISPDALCLNVEDTASLSRAQTIILEHSESGERVVVGA